MRILTLSCEIFFRVEVCRVVLTALHRPDIISFPTMRPDVIQSKSFVLLISWMLVLKRTGVEKRII